MKKLSRRGMTLLELAACLAIITVTTTLVIPFIRTVAEPPPRRTAEEMLDVLELGRKLAVEHNVSSTIVIDPKTGYYRIDTTGVFGTGTAEYSQLDMLLMETIQTDADRLRYFFRPAGSALGDTARVLGADSAVVVWVDPWSGHAHAGNQYLYNATLFPR